MTPQRVQFGSKCSAFLVLCILTICFSVSGSSGGEVAVEGLIRFPDGEVPVYAYASLTAEGLYRSVEADDSGHYAFEDIPNGTYRLFVFGGGQNQTGAFTKRDVLLNTQTQRPLVANVTLLTDPEAIRQQ